MWSSRRHAWDVTPRVMKYALRHKAITANPCDAVDFEPAAQCRTESDRGHRVALVARSVVESAEFSATDPMTTDHGGIERNRAVPQKGRWTGDPVWLADVLRAEGVSIVEYPGWQGRGHGGFKDIRGVMVHHTGSDNASAASIANGRPDLPGPLSQLHIAGNGTVTVVAVGVAWHAGVGMYPWLPTNMGNWHMIGIECANSGTSPTASHRTNWPDAQYFALVRCCAAINRRLAQNSSRTIGHKEYAGRAQGKWDPGANDMDVLRCDIQALIDSIANPATTPRPPARSGSTPMSCSSAAPRDHSRPKSNARPHFKATASMTTRNHPSTD
jgi:hypothetical protein